MNDGLKKILIFAAGAITGSLITYKMVKDSYAQIAQEEIDSVKEFYRKSAEEALSILDEADKAQKDYEDGVTKDKPDIKSYSSRIKNITNESSEDEYTDDIYVISPDDFDEIDDYESVSLIYYSDGVLTDEMNNIIEDVEGIVGTDFSDHFGDYGEEDAVYIRNDGLKCDYEILMDDKKYSDICN